MEKRKCYRDKQLWYDSLLHCITVAYEQCRDGGGWAASQGPTDNKTPGSFGMSATEANKLEFDANAGSTKFNGNGNRNNSQLSGSRNCSGCGSPDHMLRDCPHRNKGGGNNNIDGNICGGNNIDGNIRFNSNSGKNNRFNSRKQ